MGRRSHFENRDAALVANGWRVGFARSARPHWHLCLGKCTKSPSPTMFTFEAAFHRYRRKHGMVKALEDYADLRDAPNTARA